MQHPNTYVIIMAGGIGSRFWPLSRRYFPKQFQDILGTGRSLLQQTVKRFEPVCKPDNMFVITNVDYKHLVQQQLPHFSENQILLEPFLRNTAPCIAYASYKIRERNPNANIIVSPSDHIILDTYTFIEKINLSLENVNQTDKIVTLGITPKRPDTGYGYIQAEDNQVHATIKKVKQFREKPNLETAIQFVESGNFLWNAGIFVWNVQTIIKSLETFMPRIASAFAQIKDDFYTDNETKSIEKIYATFESISIDYGVMEKAQNVFVVPCDCGWSDLGTWKSLYEQAPKDDNQNVITGQVLTYDTTNCIIKTPSNRLTVVQGLDNFIIADHDEVLLICHKDEEQRIKNFLNFVSEHKDKRFI